MDSEDNISIQESIVGAIIRAQNIYVGKILVNASLQKKEKLNKYQLPPLVHTFSGTNKKLENVRMENIYANYSQQTEKELDEYPFPKMNSTFTGRHEELMILKSLFFEKRKRIVVICGFSGYGKTEVANHFARISEGFKYIDKIFWMNAENRENLVQSFKDLAKCCKMSYANDEALIKNVYEYLKEYKCLFIFDNANHRKDILEFEPRNEHLLLIISQDKCWENVDIILLGSLTSETAIDVFKRILATYYNENDRYLYKQLAHALNAIPLALQITGSYIREQIQSLRYHFSLKYYIETLIQRQEQIINPMIPLNTSNTYSKSIYVAIKISVEKMSYERNIELQELALNILCVCSNIHAEYISIYTLLRISNINEILIRKNILEKKDKLKLLQKAMYFLANFSLISENFVDTIKIHKLIKYSLKLYFSEYTPEMQNKCYTACCMLMKEIEIDNTLLVQELNSLEKSHLIEIIINREMPNELPKNELIETFLANQNNDEVFIKTIDCIDNNSQNVEFNENYMEQQKLEQKLIDHLENRIEDQAQIIALLKEKIPEEEANKSKINIRSNQNFNNTCNIQ